MTTATVGSRTRWTAERRFYFAISVAILLVVYVGFARSFFLRPLFPDYPAATEPIFLIHGILFAAWCVLLVAQASLISVGRADVHRRLGTWGAFLAVGMVVFGAIGSLIAANRPTGFVGVPVPSLQFLVVPLFDILLFGTFVTLAILGRRDAQAHKRWMVLATVNLLGAAFARWPGVDTLGTPFAFFVLSDLFIVALVLWDFRSRGRLHGVTRLGGLAIIVSQPLRLALSETDAWLGFAGWATALVQ